ncbi:sensor histidine kinase [Streptomyces ipomoeae]|uniref:histidine kinase n=2 Tax=Streptomyces ipomoeae TaxID=103232 RepID=L1KJF3_9ACTN|nr:ATP-binding protein [Streptomyces ipomoeae]EKX60936.1 ATPase/histidine kinase/DNA gyrase B/HSP90 domain protein [Streptomyces ipomoeae 91-03]MDX2698791.1 ATP-binding protein [Streptomyces ipomoeae]MDX2840217.1 ATP-binding protein [Streptomyces ipomoeae]MDX2938519.1 ATP-binding protein [Streptomyces ipomoeae]TQE23527.1 sensor histidine kinase [Streptomyces ipomoeae]
MTQYIEDLAPWALLVLTLVAAILLVVRQRGAARRLRQEITGLRNHYGELESQYSESVRSAQQEAESETRTALKSAMRTLQGLAAEQQRIISGLQRKYGDSVMLQDLLEIDHMNAQFGRRAQSIAVLCEGWLGRHRDVASVYDVVRSAQGRIRHFQRVQILSKVDFGVTSRAVEPVALALAELLDNATSYSSPDTVVEINVRTVPKGVCIVVDDAGVGMNEEEKARAEKLLTSERASGVSGLGNPPQFGFAVIGVLCERFGFTVSVDSTSPYGGVRAVVLLPDELLTSMPEPREPQASGEPLERREVTSAVDPAVASYESGPAPSQPESLTDDGLPRRRRKRPMALVSNSQPSPSGPSSSSGTRRRSEETAALMAAFKQGTDAGRATHPDSAERPGGARDTSSEGHEVS